MDNAYMESLSEVAERMRRVRTETAQLVARIRHARAVPVEKNRMSIFERAKRLETYVKLSSELGPKVFEFIAKLKEWFPHHL